MMLLYKVWLESRTRFLISFAAVAGLTLLFVIFNREVRPAMIDGDVSYYGYIWNAVFKGHLREIYIVLALMLGMGGLDRERAYGTVGYTLALPISRWRFVAARGFAGAIEASVLSLVPAILVPVLSPFVHESYPRAMALQFGILWTVGGVLIYAIGFLASVLFSGEYSAPMAALTFLFTYSILADLPGVEKYIFDVHDVMNGSGPHGLGTLATISFIAMMMMGLAGYVTTKRDY